jgi:hypothetical protein
MTVLEVQIVAKRCRVRQTEGAQKTGAQKRWLRAGRGGYCPKQSIGPCPAQKQNSLLKAQRQPAVDDDGGGGDEDVEMIMMEVVVVVKRWR